MEGVTEKEIPFDFAVEEALFRKTFALLKAALGEDTCQRWLGNKFGGGFSTHHFEAFSIGLARVINAVNLDDVAQVGRMSDALVSTKKNEDLKPHTQGGGKNSPGLYRDKLKFVEHHLRAAL
jgi:hypothetical protein